MEFKGILLLLKCKLNNDKCIFGLVEFFDNNIFWYN